MRSSRTPRAWVLGGLLCALGARAQTPVEGFNAERFSPSAPGAGWFVMDSLDMHGELGGALAFSARYARAPLRVGGLAVVTDSAYGQVAGALTWYSWRFSVGFDFPFAVKGRSGTVGGYQYTAPDVDLGSRPDTISDVRIGVDTRLLGDATSPFRLGLGAQLWIPSGLEEDYVTDGTYRGMVRLLFAGDVRWFTYAGHVGVHIRPRDDGGVPGAPRGSELLFGAAAGGSCRSARPTARCSAPRCTARRRSTASSSRRRRPPRRCSPAASREPSSTVHNSGSSSAPGRA